MSDTGFDETPEVTSRLVHEFAAEGLGEHPGRLLRHHPDHISAINPRRALEHAPTVPARPRLGPRPACCGRWRRHRHSRPLLALGRCGTGPRWFGCRAVRSDPGGGPGAGAFASFGALRRGGGGRRRLETPSTGVSKYHPLTQPWPRLQSPTPRRCWQLGSHEDGLSRRRPKAYQRVGPNGWSMKSPTAVDAPGGIATATPSTCCSRCWPSSPT